MKARYIIGFLTCAIVTQAQTPRQRLLRRAQSGESIPPLLRHRLEVDVWSCIAPKDVGGGGTYGDLRRCVGYTWRVG